MWWFIIISMVIAFVIYSGHKASKVDWGGPTVNWIDGLVRLLCKYIHRLPTTEIPLPDSGAAIVVANHVSGLDPFLLIAASRRPLRFLIAREEYERPVLHWLFKASGCIPVDRHGKPELALRQALRALQAGEVVALFPHGKIHLDSDPPRKIKGGVARLAAWSEATIYPVRIDGIGAQGTVALAPIIPSHVILTLNEAISCQPEQLVSCIADITLAIETPASMRG
ncbi:1-acyl-sn-glycerol-3-phosphate acyltransferase [Methylophaga sp. 42_25_T18]|mgnify:CR=1 FL=1|nr:1-acyl-sn-glycerol-3-phosphate acyltransferase [Methylophaga sp. 42_25_T18]OUR88929.1 1-acyl-sn-glycerol-3-phosphate acyltransferase [Methylophaga sp. 42_8_T64]